LRGIVFVSGGVDKIGVTGEKGRDICIWIVKKWFVAGRKRIVEAGSGSRRCLRRFEEDGW